MSFILIGPRYLKWHYSSAVINLVEIWRNFVWFTYHLFSPGVLLKTLFAPWRRLGEGYKKGADPESWAETFVVNTLMRLVGALVRFIFIIIGVVALIIVIVAVIPVMIIWLLLPFILLGLFVEGLILLLL